MGCVGRLQVEIVGFPKFAKSRPTHQLFGQRRGGGSRNWMDIGAISIRIVLDDPPPILFAVIAVQSPFGHIGREEELLWMIMLMIVVNSGSSR